MGAFQKLKYSHSEVGNFSIENLEYEQNEIEFMPVDVEDAADQLVIAKWIMRSLAQKYGVNITLLPRLPPEKPEAACIFIPNS